MYISIIVYEFDLISPVGPLSVAPTAGGAAAETPERGAAAASCG